jgi:O-antigen/teichoic acid export membrane protein
VVATLIGFLTISAVGFISRYSQNTLNVLFLIAIIKSIEGFQEVCWGINQRVDHMDSVGISRLLRALTCLLAMGLGLLIRGDLLISLSLWGILWVLILVFYDVPQAKRVEPLFCRLGLERTKEILIQIFPLALIAGLVSLNDKASQYQIAGLLGETAVGYYSPLAYVIQGIGLGVMSIAESAMPRLAMYYRSNRRAYVRGTLLLAGVGALIGIIAFGLFGLLRKDLLPVLYTREFLDYQGLFLVLLLTGVIRFAYSGFGVAVTAAGRFYQQTPSLLFSLLVLYLTGQFLIPVYGLLGAAYSLGLSTICLFVSFFFVWLKSISGKAE